VKRMLIVVAALVAALVPGAHASAAVGTSFPAGFPVITDASLGAPVIGFGVAGPLEHTGTRPPSSGDWATRATSAT
jgi:hypothetical protein